MIVVPAQNYASQNYQNRLWKWQCPYSLFGCEKPEEKKRGGHLKGENSMLFVFEFLI